MTLYSIIDVDTHVSEAPDLWSSRVPASMRDRVPHLEQDARGRDIWVIDGERVSLAGLLATAGRGDFKEYPATYSDMHPGAHNARERLKYMDELGIWAKIGR
ncbi:MAG: amidohydrolase, partial [Phycisphaerales bacterium]